MKLSYRDKVIFICAIVVIILIAGFFLFVKPKAEEMNLAKSVLETKQVEKQGVEDKINTLPMLVTQLKDLATSIEETQSYFLAEQAPYLNEQFIHEILDSANVEVQSISTQYTTASSIAEYMVNPTNINAYNLLIQADLYNELPQEVYDRYNNVASPSPSTITIGVTSITIGYSDTYELTRVFNFIDTIAEDDRTMSVLTVSSGAEPEEGTAETAGSITMRLYSIFPLNIEKVMEETDEIEIVSVDETVTEEVA